MTITCDVAPGAHCVCVQREVGEKHIHAGAMFFGYGTVPPKDGVLEHGIQTAVEAVAGTVTQAMEQGMNDSEKCEDLQQIAHLTATALRTASRNLWELCRCAGQGIYVGGVIAYFHETQYIALAFGGAGVLLFAEDKLQNLVPPASDRLIHDAVGGRNGWSGKFIHGILPPGGILLGTTDIPLNWRKCEEQIREYAGPGIHVNTAAMALRNMIATRPDAAAVIEFANNQEGGTR